MKRLLTVLCGSLACAPAFASLVFVTSPGGLGSNDSTNWAQLGGDQTTLSGGFSATSALSVGVTGSFAVSNGLVVVVCPSGPSCGWGPVSGGMAPGDTDVAAFDNGTNLGTGPITLTFSTALVGAGAWIDGDTSGTYTAAIQAFNGSTSLGAAQTLTSDASGDPIFLGLVEQGPATADITKIVFSLTSCGGCTNLGDFAIDTLLMTDSGSATPEPSSMLLMGGGLLGMGWVLRKKSRKNS